MKYDNKNVKKAVVDLLKAQITAAGEYMTRRAALIPVLSDPEPPPRDGVKPFEPDLPDGNIPAEETPEEDADKPWLSSFTAPHPKKP
jgi:hypothetical protein